MAKQAPKLVRKNTRQLAFNQRIKPAEITATVAVNHYKAVPKTDALLELELVKHGSNPKTVAAVVDREELVELAHWLLQNYDTTQGGA